MTSRGQVCDRPGGRFRAGAGHLWGLPILLAAALFMLGLHTTSPSPKTSVHDRDTAPIAEMFTYDVGPVLYDNDANLVAVWATGRSGAIDRRAAGASGRSLASLRELVAPRVPVGALDDATQAAFRAADNVGAFAVKPKHLPGAGGRWNQFAQGVDPYAAIEDALRSGNARFMPNPNLPDTFGW